MRKAICLALISTADLRARFINNHGKPICKRTAEYLAAAARVALGGIGRHLARNPVLGKRLQAQWDRYQQNGDEWDYTLDSDMLTDLNWYEWNAA
ncbi:hypothetical protein [Pseudomonas syringae]|uniref:hypothetical protein n=1 Tax=Pseudomonas syringae TaxID=317 RepID=UPI0011C386E7